MSNAPASKGTRPTGKIASKTGRASHVVVFDTLWDVERAACGASTFKYKIHEGAADTATCSRCK